MINITRCRHEWPERAGFALNRPSGTPEYVFLHFLTPVELSLCGEVRRLEAGACFVYRPGTPQRFRSEEKLIHDWAHIEGDVEARMAAFGILPETVYYPEDGNVITRIFRELEIEKNTERVYTAELIDIKLSELFLRTSRASSGEERRTVRPDVYAAFKELRFSIFDSLSEDWQVSRMAAAVHMSESRFHVVYKQIYGISPTNDLILARVEKAKDLLAANIYTNAQVAEAVGYNNEYHFIRQFRRFAGITPKAYALRETRENG